MAAGGDGNFATQHAENASSGSAAGAALPEEASRELSLTPPPDPPAASHGATPLGLDGTTSSGPATTPPINPGAGDHGDTWIFPTDVDFVDEFDDDSENEPLFPLLPQRHEEDEEDVDVLLEDTPGIDLVGKASSTYSSIGKTADAMDVDHHALRNFLLDNPDVLEIAEYHKQNYVSHPQDGASDTPKGNNAHSMETVVAHLLAAEAGGNLSPYRSPPTSKIHEFQPIEHLAYSVFRMHDRLCDAGLRHELWDQASLYKAAFLALKAREILDTTPRKMRQARSSQAKHHKYVTDRRGKQVATRTNNAKELAAQPSSASGTLRRSKGTKAARDGPTVRQRPKPADPAQASSDSEASDTDPYRPTAPVVPIPDSTHDIMDSIQATTDTRRRDDPIERERRMRARISKRLTLRDRIELLNKDKVRQDAYKKMQVVLRNSVVDFFEDFTEVDVTEFRERCLEPLQTAKPTPESLLANDPGQALRISDADKDAAKEKAAQHLSANWAAEQARELEPAIDTDQERDDLTAAVDLPPPSQAYKDMARTWSKMINAREYQDEGLKPALARCYIKDIAAMRVPYQSAGIQLHWWQVIAAAWSDKVVRRFGQSKEINNHTGWTKGGLLADEIGLGKTLEYGAAMLLDIYEQEQAYDAAPDGSKPLCKPILIMTLPSLITQTVTEIRKLSPYPFIAVLHAAASITTTSTIVQVSNSAQLDSVWDTTKRKNLRTIVITSFDTFNSQHGPRAQNKWHQSRDPSFKLPPKGKQPDADPRCPSHPAGLVRMVIVDEPQVGCRNPTGYWTAIKWLDADQVFLYSGSPAPRGLEDIASYLGLFEHTDVARDAKRPHTVEGDVVWSPDIDPYALPDDDPRVKFRYTRSCFMDNIVNLPGLSSYDRGMRAKKVMPHFILRRDYQSECPFDSGNTIAKNMPDLTHFSIERTFSPSAKALYDRAVEQWRPRLVLTEKDAVTGEIRRMPNPRAYRADAVCVTYPYAIWLHVPNPHYQAPDSAAGPALDHEISTPENDPDYFSWFRDNSDHYKSTAQPGKSLRMHRWLLSRAVYLRTKIDPTAPVDVAMLPWTDAKQVSNGRVLREILKWSPKMAMILVLLVKHVLLRDEKVIIWFTHPINLLLCQEILSVLDFFKETGRVATLTAKTTPAERARLQERINNLDDPLKVVLGANKVGAVGLNYQRGCWTQFHHDVAETLDVELQAIGRSFRIGQLMNVIIYSFLMAGSLDAIALERMLLRSLASTAAMMKHTDDDSLPSVDAEPATQDPTAQASGTTEDNMVTDYMAAFFKHTDRDGNVEILHFKSDKGKAVIEEIRAMMLENAEFDDDPSVIEKWLPEPLEPAVATMMLMRGARANLVIQHGGWGKSATADLAHAVLQEVSARATADGSADGSADEAMDVDDDERDEPDGCNYDPERDPVFLSGHINFQVPDHQLPVRQARSNLLPPQTAAIDDEDWLSMTDAEKRKRRFELDALSKGRHDTVRKWDTAASKPSPKPKGKGKGKLEDKKGADNQTAADDPKGKGKRRLQDNDEPEPSALEPATKKRVGRRNTTEDEVQKRFMFAFPAGPSRVRNEEGSKAASTDESDTGSPAPRADPGPRRILRVRPPKKG